MLDATFPSCVFARRKELARRGQEEEREDKEMVTKYRVREGVDRRKSVGVVGRLATVYHRTGSGNAGVGAA